MVFFAGFGIISYDTRRDYYVMDSELKINGTN